MPQALQTFLDEQSFGGDLQQGLLATVLAVFFVWAVHAVVQRVVIKRIGNPTARYSARKGTQYAALIVGVILVGRIWYAGFDSFATFVGLVGAGFAIALRDPVANLAGWAFLIVRHPIRVGDRVCVGDHLGDVVDIGLFQFELHELGAWVDADQPTGRVVFIPNSFVFREPQLNYHRGLPHIWEELAVPITFESNWEAAKALLVEIAHRHAVSRPQNKKDDGRKSTGFFLLEGLAMSEVYTNVRENGVVLTVRYAVEPRERRRKEMLVWEDILRAFRARSDIHFAYTTYRRVELPTAPTAAKEGALPR